MSELIADRSMWVRPTQIVRTDWVAVDQCKLGCRERMHFAAIERAGRRYVQAGDCQFWPPLVGHWEEGRFVVCDGRHELLSLMALGRDKVFVAWLEEAGAEPADKPVDYPQPEITFDKLIIG